MALTRALKAELKVDQTILDDPTVIGDPSHYNHDHPGDAPEPEDVVISDMTEVHEELINIEAEQNIRDKFNKLKKWYHIPKKLNHYLRRDKLVSKEKKRLIEEYLKENANAEKPEIFIRKNGNYNNKYNKEGTAAADRHAMEGKGTDALALNDTAKATINDLAARYIN